MGMGMLVVTGESAKGAMPVLIPKARNGRKMSMIHEQQAGKELNRRIVSSIAAAVVSSQSLVPLCGCSYAMADMDVTSRVPAQNRQTVVDEKYFSPSSLYTAPDVFDRLKPLPKEFPELPPPNLPKYHRMKLNNGLRVILLEDHEAPFIQGILAFPAGSRASPPDKVGLASLAGALQRSAGSVQHPYQVLDDILEDRAAAIETNVTPDTFSIGFSTLTEDVPFVMGLFSEVVLNPSLDHTKLEIIKKQFVNRLIHRNDDPTSIPSREVAKLIYGRNSPYVHEPTVSGLKSLQVKDVRDWIDEWERPDTAVLGIVGDINIKKMENMIRQKFESWRPAYSSAPTPLPAPQIPDFNQISGRIFVINRSGSSQASIAVGEPGVQMMDPDECALDILGDLFNGFDGRLFNEIRSKEGLAYSVGGGWTASPPDHPGLFIATAETEQPSAALLSLRRTLSKVLETPPTSEEVQRAQEENMNRFVFSFASPRGNLRRAVVLELLNLPEDYPIQYMKRLSTVNKDDVKIAAERHLHPDEQIVVIVGDVNILKTTIQEKLGKSIETLNLEDV